MRQLHWYWFKGRTSRSCFSQGLCSCTGASRRLLNFSASIPLEVLRRTSLSAGWMLFPALLHIRNSLLLSSQTFPLFFCKRLLKPLSILPLLSVNTCGSLRGRWAIVQFVFIPVCFSCIIFKTVFSHLKGKCLRGGHWSPTAYCARRDVNKKHTLRLVGVHTTGLLLSRYKTQVHFLLKFTLYWRSLSAVRSKHKTFWDLNHLYSVKWSFSSLGGSLTFFVLSAFSQSICHLTKARKTLLYFMVEENKSF